MARIFLFSDGLANVGLQSHEDIWNLVKKIRQEGSTVSAFGIGSDFDEKLMLGISEHGSGYYFLMNNAENIPKYVEKATDDLLKLIGSESVLKIRGKNGTVLKKIFDHDDLIGGAKLRDLRESNLQQLVAQFDVTPVANAASAEILTWELSYISAETKKTDVMQGSLIIGFTDNENDVKKENTDVLVAVIVQEVGEIDKTILRMMDEGKTGEAVIQKSIAIQMLKEVLDKDNTGFVKRILANAERMYEDMQNKKKNAAAVRKNLDYNGYLNRRASFSAMNEMEMNFCDEIVADPIGSQPVDLNTSLNSSTGSPPASQYIISSRNRRLS